MNNEALGVDGTLLDASNQTAIASRPTKATKVIARSSPLEPAPRDHRRYLNLSPGQQRLYEVLVALQEESIFT